MEEAGHYGQEILGLPWNEGSGFERFSLVVHYRGILKKEVGQQCYIGGNVHVEENLQLDLMSMLELEDLREKLGYSEVAGFYYLVPGKSMKTGLRKLNTDADVLGMGEVLGVDRKIVMFFEHKLGETSKELAVTLGSKQLLEYEDFEDFSSNGDDSDSEDFEEDNFSEPEYEEHEEYEEYEYFDGFLKCGNEVVSEKQQYDDEEVADEEAESEEVDEEQVAAAKKLKSLNRKRGIKKRLVLDYFNPETDMANVKLYVGLVFPDAKTFKDAVREHAIKEGRQVWFPCNERGRVRGVCKARKGTKVKCCWKVYASTYEPNNPVLLIKSLEEKHKCPRVSKNRCANSSWLSKRYTDSLRPGVEFKLGDFLSKVREDYILQPSRGQVYRAKTKAGEIVEGTLAGQYGKLWDYAEELRRSNPGSTVVIDNDMGPNQTLIFKRIYICFAACKTGWMRGCRPIIGLDGCHIKGHHKAQLFLAVGVDSDNGYYPIAYAVVEKECYKTWHWFLEILKCDLKLENPLGMTFMTDKQKGLIEAVGALFDGCEHRHCVRHLYANFVQKHKGDLVRVKLWEAARSTTVMDFQRVMEEIKIINENAHKWLTQRPAYQWSKSHFREWPKCDMLLNNMVESVNGDKSILEARSLPIYSMLERLRVKIMNRRASKRMYMAKWYAELGPKVCEILELSTKASGQFMAHWGGASEYQVNRNNLPAATVDLSRKSCTCRRWNLTGLPCKHAIAAILTNNEDPQDYVDNWYQKSKMEMYYSDVLHGIKVEKDWHKTGLPPLAQPLYVKQAGRPRKVRIRELGEILANTRRYTKIRKQYTCGTCKQQGHSKASCARRADLEAKAKKTGKAKPGEEAPKPSDESLEIQKYGESVEDHRGDLTQEPSATTNEAEEPYPFANLLRMIIEEPTIVDRFKEKINTQSIKKRKGGK